MKIKKPIEYVQTPAMKLIILNNRCPLLLLISFSAAIIFKEKNIPIQIGSKKYPQKRGNASVDIRKVPIIGI